jgi:3-hydroxyisobutyrate dehydrogenase-like beta-hydroxyacid dehydrogenase
MATDDAVPETNASDKDVVGVVGLGAIGGNVARSLAASGLYTVVGYDPREEAYAQFPEVRPIPSARLLAEMADTVLVAVYDDAQLRTALTGPDGILVATPPPATVCVLSTVTLTTLRWAAEEAARVNVELIDCGVTGGSGLRVRGKIVVLAGGSDKAIAAVRPVLEVFGDPVLHMGDLGAGMKAKLARNLMHYSGWYAAWEAARVADACGIDVRKLVQAHEISNAASSGGGTSLLMAGIGPGLPFDPHDEDSIARRQRSAGFAKKDLQYISELAEEIGISLPGAELVRERIDLVVGLADEDAS